MDDLLPEPLPADDADRRLLADIQDCGVHVVYVPPEVGTPGWAFSIGLFRSHRSPEVIVFGLPQDVSLFVVNELASRAATAPLVAEQLYDGLLDAHPCILKPVQAVWHRTFVGYATWYYRQRQFPLLQCVWPDHAHLFPWDPGFRASWLWAQPLLFHGEPVPARAEALLRSMGRSSPA